MYDLHDNWIGGEALPALSKDVFEVRCDGSREILGAWARSSARDLSLALDDAEDASAGWLRAGPAARRVEIERAIHQLALEADADGLLSRALGLDASEIAVHTENLAHDLLRALDVPQTDLARGPIGAREGPLFLATDWTEMWFDPARRLFFALVSGRTAVVLSDGRAPMIADAFARALRHLPPGVVAIVHDDGRTCLRRAIEEPRFQSVHLPIAGDDDLEIEERARQHAVELTATFASRSAIDLRRLACQSFVVPDGSDLEAAAHHVVTRAFSRAHALSGARPASIGRVLCSARQFSRFTECLLAVLDHDGDVARPIASVQSSLAPHVERAFKLGHDEGATAIFTGPAESHLVFPLVFTNVDERMRIARLSRPAPVVCLFRTRGEADGFALAARLENTV